ncbi:MAG TPA: TMEM165/GDT1 family protein, partial [Bacillota bacterium]|nr:TMEM165/GDT1 family protein [Bacillota bacterium]
MDEFIKAFALIFVAEMGDKTQILAMAFATKYSMGKVLLGILVGSALNHGLAVLLGSYISNTVSTNIIQVVAGLIFIAFALWTLRLDYQDAKEENQRVKLGPVLTVAIAFFIGELGDKTQLTAITLSVDAQYPWIVLLGTVLGMITTGALGIFVGRKLGDRIPELAVKLVASALFMAFGIGKLTSSLPEEYLNTSNYLTFFAILLLAILLIVRSNRRGLKKNNETAFKTRARDLYAYYNK